MMERKVFSDYQESLRSAMIKRNTGLVTPRTDRYIGYVLIFMTDRD